VIGSVAGDVDADVVGVEACGGELGKDALRIMQISMSYRTPRARSTVRVTRMEAGWANGVRGQAFTGG
jgi:hypothetical protein